MLFIWRSLLLPLLRGAVLVLVCGMTLGRSTPPSQNEDRGWTDGIGGELAVDDSSTFNVATAIDALRGEAPQAAQGEAKGAQPFLLLGPSLDTWLGQPWTKRASTAFVPGKRDRNDPRPYAMAYQLRSEIYQSAQPQSKVIGYVRRGYGVPVLHQASGKGCEGGVWYRVEPMGFVCTKRGFVVSKDDYVDITPLPSPDISKPLPYVYGHVRRSGTARFDKVPSPADEARVELARAGAASWPSIADRTQSTDYYVAIRNPRRSGSPRYYQSFSGRYIRSSDIDVLGTPPMYGEELGSGTDLPLAFVYTEGAKVYCGRRAPLRVCGMADKHARFQATRTVSVGGQQYVESTNGFLVPRSALRVAKKRERPRQIASNARWLHIDIAEQVLIAYEGSKAVYATLISSGRQGYTTPPGLFRIREKLITATMSGQDKSAGPYEVEEVPWVMFYHEGFAIHAAFWHNDFGRTRSHGCTNLAPVDARWVYDFTSPKAPEGWYAIRTEGTWIWLTS